MLLLFIFSARAHLWCLAEPSLFVSNAAEWREKSENYLCERKKTICVWKLLAEEEKNTRQGLRFYISSMSLDASEKILDRRRIFTLDIEILSLNSLWYCPPPPWTGCTLCSHSSASFDWTENFFGMQQIVKIRRAMFWSAFWCCSDWLVCGEYAKSSPPHLNWLGFDRIFHHTVEKIVFVCSSAVLQKFILLHSFAR